MQVLEELDVGHIPMISVWNKVDVCADPEMVQTVASKRDNTVCISAHTGEGLPTLMNLVQQKIEQSMMPINVLVPYAQVFADHWACAILFDSISFHHCFCYVLRGALLPRPCAVSKLAESQCRPTVKCLWCSG